MKWSSFHSIASRSLALRPDVFVQHRPELSTRTLLFSPLHVLFLPARHRDLYLSLSLLVGFSLSLVMLVRKVRNLFGKAAVAENPKIGNN